MGPETASMSVGMGIAITGGSISLTGIIIAFITWSLKRNVDHEDRTKEKLDGQVAELVKWRTEMGVNFKNLENAQAETRGALASMKETMETNREKMSAYYRDELGKMESRLELRLDAMQSSLRQDVMRVTDSTLPDRVAKLEVELAALKGGRRKR